MGVRCIGHRGRMHPLTQIFEAYVKSLIFTIGAPPPQIFLVLIITARIQSQLNALHFYFSLFENFLTPFVRVCTVYTVHTILDCAVLCTWIILL